MFILLLLIVFMNMISITTVACIIQSFITSIESMSCDSGRVSSPHYMMNFVYKDASANTMSNLDLFTHIYNVALESNEYIYINIALNIMLSIGLNLLRMCLLIE